VFFASAPLPAPESEKLPLPATETPIAAARASILVFASALTVTVPGVVTVEASMVASVMPPIEFSARLTAIATEIAALPLPAMEAEAATISALIAEVSEADSSTLPPAPTVEPLAMVADVKLVVVFLAIAPLPAPSRAKDPLPETDTPIAAARASMLLFETAVTITAPPVSTVELSIDASVVLPMLFAARVTAIEIDTAPELLAPIEAEADTTSEVIEEVSDALTDTSPIGAPTSLPEINAEIVLVVVLLALAPLPAPESEKLLLAEILAEAAIATALMVLLPVADTVTEPAVLSTSEAAIRAEVEPPILFSASVTDTPTPKAAELDAAI
jgi:hypothetical protein